MSKQNGLTSRLAEADREQDGPAALCCDLPVPARGAIAGIHGVIDLIRAEMVRSADRLSNLASSLTKELLGLMRLGSAPEVEPLVSRMSKIRQSEGRLQQRFHDLCTALTMLQESLETHHDFGPEELCGLIARHLRLNEMRAVFTGEVVPNTETATSGTTVCAGDVDLF